MQPDLAAQHLEARLTGRLVLAERPAVDQGDQGLAQVVLTATEDRDRCTAAAGLLGRGELLLAEPGQ